MARWIKMPLGTEVGLDPGDFVLDRNPAPSSPKRGRSPTIFSPCILWPNGGMDQDGTWHGGRPWSRPHCVRWGPSSPHQKGGEAPNSCPCLLWPNDLMDQDGSWRGGGLGPGHIVLDRDPAPLPKRGQSPNFRPMSIVAKRLYVSGYHMVRR